MNNSFLHDQSLFSVSVRDPLWKDISLTPELQDIIRSEPFLRLYRIRQLGPTEMVYPGATHSRASHSLGVYHLSLRLIRLMDSRKTDFNISEVACRSFLAAALLHDLGHFPYTHSLKELPLDDHEQLTALIILKEPLATLLNNFGADPSMTAAIVDQGMPVDPDNQEIIFFRKILSGVLDPDKLDYLNRDAYYCGVPYGLQDTDFIFSRVQFDIKKGITLDSSAIMSIENVLFSKYLMYRSVYWHRQVRIATAMMKKALWTALEDGSINPDELYPLDDPGILNLLHSRGGISASIAADVKTRQFYSILAEFRFNEEDPEMLKLEELNHRSMKEKEISAWLSLKSGIDIKAEDVLIDIPERISFESDLFIRDENCSFSQSSTVFTPALVQNFTRSLRMVRVAINPEKGERIDTQWRTSEILARCIGVDYTI